MFIKVYPYQVGLDAKSVWATGLPRRTLPASLAHSCHARLATRSEVSRHDERCRSRDSSEELLRSGACSGWNDEEDFLSNIHHLHT